VGEQQGVRVHAQCRREGGQVVDVDAPHVLRWLGAGLGGPPVLDLVEGVGAEVVAAPLQLG
jgi:hypothetical protein